MSTKITEELERTAVSRSLDRVVRDGIWRKKRTIDEDARAERAKELGYRLATYGDGKPSHAICRHGHLAEITEDHHACSWTPLVPNVGSEPFPTARKTSDSKP